MISLLTENEKYLIAQVNLTEANLTHADAFKSELINLLDTKKRSIWLDLQKVTYVDSSFLGALVAALKKAISIQCDLILLGPQSDILGLLKLIKLDKVFKIYPNEEAAVQEMN